MGRFRSSSDEGAEAGIDISPLMDCVFILLIFFIVTTTFVEERGVQVEKLSPGQPSNQEKENVLIAITEQGEVLCDGSKIGISGVRQIVRDRVRTEDTPVIVQADEAVSTGLLIRVIDEARLGGAPKVSVATRKGSKG